MWNYPENPFASPGSNNDSRSDDEEVLRKWVGLQRSPTYVRARNSVFRDMEGNAHEVDVCVLSTEERQVVLDRLIKAVDEDPELFFSRMRKRFDVVGLEFPRVEVRFEHLKVDALVHVGSRALHTIPNSILNMCEALLGKCGIFLGKRMKLSILDDISGVIKPSRLTLLLGPPSSGKTTLLLALAGRLGDSVQMSGKVTYNGYSFKEFVPQRTSAYVSQKDQHMAEMTVREILELSGRCQGVGFKYEMLLELLRREKSANINPGEDLDILIKAMSLGEQKTSLYAEYIMKILGLDNCADTLVGDEMLRGISGGQKKRLTTGELLVGTSRVLLMDEISTGLDSSTTHQIIRFLRNSTHAFDGTTIVSLLQPDPETYSLFDDIVLLCEGQIVYQGPCEDALHFFAYMGFICPERKNVADFLQEVMSEKDQRQYWSRADHHYQYVPVARFVEAFKSFCTGDALSRKLSVPYNRRRNHPAALSTSLYGASKFELLKMGFSWQMLILKRNLFLFVFKYIQLILITSIIVTVFFRSTMHHNTLDDGGVYLGAIYFAILMILFNGFMEVPLLIAKLPVLYKHRDLRFYPCWVYTIPSWIMSIPSSLIETVIWVAITYYGVGFDPQLKRCLLQFLVLFLLHQMSIALFRTMASLGRNLVVANTFGSFAMLVVMSLGGFILSRDSIPKWWIWGYWVSPLMYAQNAASVNEFLSPSWDKIAGNNTSVPLGATLLKVRSVFPESYWYWIGAGALLSYILVLNILFTLFLTYLNPLGVRHTVITKSKHHVRDKEGLEENGVIELGEFLQQSFSYTGRECKALKGMVLPFEPLSMCFNNINYYIDVPAELKSQGVVTHRLQLLVNVTGSFRPGILTALVGISGAGKTTLMDVLAGRKTGGTIEGSIYISGFPKKQETFARVSGYCEQNDVHSPCLTVYESLVFSASLRLPSHVDMGTKISFVEEVMELVELTQIRNALVGMPGVDGLSTEQRKRLTIAVELVANPSIVFMDEPTSGLDARSAAIVMRTVRNIVNTGRTIVCTIHQPSIDIFESFDELLLMKRGGKMIYAGPLGQRSRDLITYFEAIVGVPKIKSGQNPAAWVLEVTSPAEEARLGLDFAAVYRQSNRFRVNKHKVAYLSAPELDSEDLSFPTKYSQTLFSQFCGCFWKQYLSYWRNPQYTAVRFFYTIIISLMFGTICWKFGSKRDTQQDILNAMGAMYSAILFMGIANATAVQPVVSVERAVSYRERAAGMYSALPFAFAQVTVEVPYVLVQSIIYTSIFYSMAGFELSIVKCVWYLFFTYFTLLYFNFFGMMVIAITPNHNVAAIVGAPFFMMWSLFSGFMIPYMMRTIVCSALLRRRIPVWWRWYYWADPVAWSLYGLLTSQYGNLDEQLVLAGSSQSVPIKQFLRDHFGYKHELLGIAALAMVGFCLVFILIFAFAIRSFNFQRR